MTLRGISNHLSFPEVPLSEFPEKQFWINGYMRIYLKSQENCTKLRKKII